MCTELVESILGFLEEEGCATIIGKHTGFREKVVKSVITAAVKAYDGVVVVDWYGAYNVGVIPTIEPVLPYPAAAKYLPFAVSSMLGLYKIGYLVEGLVYEAVETSENFSQVLSRLRVISSTSSLARTILFRIAPLKEFFAEGITLPVKFRVDLSKAPVLVRRTLSQLWAALAADMLLYRGSLLIMSEAGRAIKRGPWVWNLLDEARGRGAKVLLVDSRLLRAYLQYAIVFTDFRLEEMLAAHRYRLEALAEGWGRGKALLVREPYEHRTFEID